MLEHHAFMMAGPTSSAKAALLPPRHQQTDTLKTHRGEGQASGTKRGGSLVQAKSVVASLARRSALQGACLDASGRCQGRTAAVEGVLVVVGIPEVASEQEGVNRRAL